MDHRAGDEDRAAGDVVNVESCYVVAQSKEKMAWTTQKSRARDKVVRKRCSHF